MLAEQEAFSWSAKAETLSGPIVEGIDSRLNRLIGDGKEITFLREALSQQTVGAFVDAPLPGEYGTVKYTLVVRVCSTSS